jgi:hypothetical protein
MKRKINSDQNLDELIHTITDTLPASCNVIMAQKFSQLVEDINAKKNSDILLSEEDKKLIAKMEMLKQAEKNLDLAWMDYGSWNRFSELMQERFILLIDPLFYDGIFFTYSKLIENDHVFQHLSEGVAVYVVKSHKSLRIYCIDSKDSSYHWMNVKTFSRIEAEIVSGTVKTYCKGENNSLIVTNIIGAGNAGESSSNQ